MFHVPENKRITWDINPVLGSDISYGNNGAFRLTLEGAKLLIIASNGGGWEHVSVTRRDRQSVPTWRMMCLIKNIFWDPEDCVIQYHPPASKYINRHPGCLHLWRMIGYEFPLPPEWMIGTK
jgi:hypothetical protein